MALNLKVVGIKNKSENDLGLRKEENKRWKGD